ncbi:hypothetical protein QBC45DRAFT_73623 [Copromyces sp. CBS 386.78]|nr:hypothetical protein QBC45DRAFT_73623 [Copromyces sp. CBS 386.78]
MRLGLTSLGFHFSIFCTWTRLSGTGIFHFEATTLFTVQTPKHDRRPDPSRWAISPTSLTRYLSEPAIMSYLTALGSHSGAPCFTLRGMLDIIFSFPEKPSLTGWITVIILGGEAIPKSRYPESAHFLICRYAILRYAFRCHQMRGSLCVST